MADHATPNLPSRGLDATTLFYAEIGFGVVFRDTDWLILQRGGVTLEFFPHPGLDPGTNDASCCLRLDDVDEFHSVCLAAGLSETSSGWPRLHRPQLEESGLRIGALVDPDCNLLRLIQNPG